MQDNVYKEVIKNCIKTNIYSKDKPNIDKINENNNII